MQLSDVHNKQHVRVIPAEKRNGSQNCYRYKKGGHGRHWLYPYIHCPRGKNSWNTSSMKYEIQRLSCQSFCAHQANHARRYWREVQNLWHVRREGGQGVPQLVLILHIFWPRLFPILCEVHVAHSVFFFLQGFEKSVRAARFPPHCRRGRDGDAHWGVLRREGAWETLGPHKR